MKTINRILTFFILAIAWLVVMTSCAEMPLTLAVEGNYGTYSYSSKCGLRASLRIREEKSGPITAEEIANRWKP